MGAIVSQAEVEAYLSTPIVRATYDDNNDGAIDSESLRLIIEISEALFLAHVRGVVPVPLTAPIDPFAKYVVCQIVHCQSIKRSPEVFRQGLSVCEEVTAILKQIRSGELQIATPPAPTVYGGGPQAESFSSRYIRESDFGGGLRSASFENPGDDD